MSTDPPPPPPAGWYPDGSGQLRWWSGQSWATSGAEPAPERAWASIAHVMLFAVTVIGPLVVYLTVGRRDRFVKHHACEALNAQIWFGIVWNALLVPLVVAAARNPGAGPPDWMLAAVPLAFLSFAVAGGFAVRGVVQASRGVWWRYPLPFRFVRG